MESFIEISPLFTQRYSQERKTQISYGELSFSFWKSLETPRTILIRFFFQDFFKTSIINKFAKSDFFGVNIFRLIIEDKIDLNFIEEEYWKFMH